MMMILNTIMCGMCACTYIIYLPLPPSLLRPSLIIHLYHLIDLFYIKKKKEKQETKFHAFDTCMDVKGKRST